jgi:hypothetical protein
LEFYYSNEQQKKIEGKYEYCRTFAEPGYASLCTVVKIATGITTNKLNKTITYKLKFKLRTRRSGVRIAPGAPYNTKA